MLDKWYPVRMYGQTYETEMTYYNEPDGYYYSIAVRFIPPGTKELGGFLGWEYKGNTEESVSHERGYFNFVDQICITYIPFDAVELLLEAYRKDCELNGVKQ